MTTSNLLGEIKTVSGVAVVQGADGLSQLAVPGMQLSLNDLILTSSQAHVDIQLVDASLTNIAADSAIALNAKDAAIDYSYELDLNNLFADITPLPAIESSKVALASITNPAAVAFTDVSAKVFAGYDTNPIDSEFNALPDEEQTHIINQINPQTVNQTDEIPIATGAQMQITEQATAEAVAQIDDASVTISQVEVVDMPSPVEETESRHDDARAPEGRAPGVRTAEAEEAETESWEISSPIAPNVEAEPIPVLSENENSSKPGNGGQANKFGYGKNDAWNDNFEPKYDDSDYYQTIDFETYDINDDDAYYKVDGYAIDDDSDVLAIGDMLDFNSNANYMAEPSPVASNSAWSNGYANALNAKAYGASPGAAEAFTVTAYSPVSDPSSDYTAAANAVAVDSV